MDFIKKHSFIIAFIVILAIGILVRVYDFGNTPYGINQDEASLGYDAWADITYGMDRNGDHNPIYAEAWNSGQNMLYNYITRPFIALLGLNIVAIRLPMMISGITTLILFYFFMKELFGKRIALLGLFLLVICPWHIMLSRWALESNFAVFTAMLSMLLFVKSRSKEILFIPAMIAASLCMYAYSVTLVFLTVFILSIVIYVFVKKIISLKYILLGICVFLILSIPMGIFLIINQLELEPCKFLWFSIPNFEWFRNATDFFKNGNGFFDILSENILRFKDVFIKMDDGLISNSTKFGAIYPMLIPFILIGIIKSINMLRDKNEHIVIPAMWFGAALLQGFMIHINVNRMNIILIPFIILATLGLSVVFKRVRGLSYVVITVCILAFTAFSGYYFNDYNKDTQWMFFGGFDDAVRYADEYTRYTEGTVYLSSHVHGPYMIAAYATKSPPAVYASSDGTHYVSGIPEDFVPQSGDAFIIKYDETIPSYLDIERCDMFELEYYTVYMIK